MSTLICVIWKSSRCSVFFVCFEEYVNFLSNQNKIIFSDLTYLIILWNMKVLFFKIQLHYKGKTFLYRKCLSGFNLMKDQNIRKEKRDLDKPSNIRSLLNMSHNTDFNLWMQILIQFCCSFIITSHLFLDIISN